MRLIVGLRIIDMRRRKTRVEFVDVETQRPRPLPFGLRFFPFGLRFFETKATEVATPGPNNQNIW